MKYKRKQKFVDREVQGALAIRVLVHWVIFCLMLSMILPIWQLMTSGNPLRFSTQAFFQQWKANAPLFVLLAMIFPAFMWDSVRLSNRFAGPILRLRKTMQSITKGEEVGELKFRNGDFWGELAGDFNAMVEHFRSQERQQEADEQAEPVLSGPGERE